MISRKNGAEREIDNVSPKIVFIFSSNSTSNSGSPGIKHFGAPPSRREASAMKSVVTSTGI